MAKGSFLGVKRGKLGDAVGYNVTNSNDKEKQGWRAYQPVVRNPQSEGQIDQRVKLQAVNNLYRALKPVIQRGWENHKYGDESRRAFLKRALGASFEGPYIEKGSTLAVPIKNVPIMYGSLPSIVGIADGTGGLFILANVPVTWESSYDLRTVGEVSVAFVNAGIAQEGDQVTFVIGSLAENGQVIYKVISFYVNANDSTNMFAKYGLAFESGQYDGQEVVILTLDQMTGINSAAFAALCSISRDGDGSHLRSYAEFAMSDAFEDYFYGNAEQNARAKASYRKTVGDSTNWEQNPDVGPLYGFTAKRGDGTVIVPVAVTISQAGYTIVEDSQSNLLYVKGTDTRMVSYNRWLKAKNGTVLSDVWNQTAPAELEPDQYIGFVSSDSATADDISFYNFLIAAGYDSRALLGLLPQS